MNKKKIKDAYFYLLRAYCAAKMDVYYIKSDDLQNDSKELEELKNKLENEFLELLED